MGYSSTSVGGLTNSGGTSNALDAATPVTTLFSGPGSVRIATDGSNVYWTNSVNRTVSKCSVDGCGNQQTLLAINQGGAYDIAVQNGQVYWTINPGGSGPASGGFLMKCAALGCALAPVQISATASPAPRDVVVDADRFYENRLNWVGGCPLTGCPFGTGTGSSVRTETAIWSNASAQVGGLTTDGIGGLYWTDAAGGYVYGHSSDGGTATALCSGLSTPTRITTDGINVYWTNIGDGTVAACGIAGCPNQNSPSILARSQGVPTDITTDGANVYWLDAQMGLVLKCAAGGCNGLPAIVADSQLSPSGIAVDARNVYWTDNDGVKKSPK
jgi:hypothetical protein